jgi:hypothetical protein
VNRTRPILAAAAAAVVLGATCQASIAQSVTPMRQVVKSFSDNFAVRIIVGNPYTHKVPFDVKVYDETFQPVVARISPATVSIGANGARNVTVIVGFNGRPERKIRICAEGLFGPANATKIRTQVCGRYLAQRVGY